MGCGGCAYDRVQALATSQLPHRLSLSLPSPPPLNMNYLGVQQPWNPQGVITTHATVPEPTDVIRALESELVNHTAPPGLNNHQHLKVINSSSLTTEHWNPRPNSLVMSFYDVHGNPLLDILTTETGYPGVVASLAGVGRHLRWRVHGVATSQLTDGATDYTSRVLAVQVAGSCNLTNTGPHAINVGDTLVAMFPDLDERTLSMKYGTSINGRWDGRYVPEIWPLREVRRELIGKARKLVRDRVRPPAAASAAVPAAPPVLADIRDANPINRLSQLEAQLPYVATRALVDAFAQDSVIAAANVVTVVGAGAAVAGAAAAIRAAINAAVGGPGGAVTTLYTDVVPSMTAVQAFVESCINNAAGVAFPEASAISIDDVVGEYAAKIVALGGAPPASPPDAPGPHYSHEVVMVWTEFISEVMRRVKSALSRIIGSRIIGRSLSVTPKGGNIHTVLSLRAPEPALDVDA